MQEARKLGIGGATLFVASEGFGHDRKLHSAHLKQESINVFYVKTPIEFGMTGEF